MSRKARPLTTKMTMFQVAVPRSLVFDPITRGARQPTHRPATTTAITPDTPTASAGR